MKTTVSIASYLWLARFGHLVLASPTPANTAAGALCGSDTALSHGVECVYSPASGVGGFYHHAESAAFAEAAAKRQASGTPACEPPVQYAHFNMQYYDRLQPTAKDVATGVTADAWVVPGFLTAKGKGITWVCGAWHNEKGTYYPCTCVAD